MKSPSIRGAVWAGRFYPGDPTQLRADVVRYLGASQAPEAGLTKAVIAPHAGYPYSGPIAGSAFHLFEGAPTPIERIVLLGPSHQVPFQGLALSSATAFETPLGRAENDPETADKLEGLAQAEVFDEAHDYEHSLEVELPFLQQILGRFQLVPLVVGEAGDREIAEVIERLWGGPETRFVISSDLSHYLDYDAARELDQATAAAIEKLEPEGIRAHQACGRWPVRGFLQAARDRGLRCRTLDLRNSGDTAGARDRVVGYGAFAFY